MESEGRRRLTSRAGDLLSSTDIRQRGDSLGSKRESREDFGEKGRGGEERGVGGRGRGGEGRGGEGWGGGGR